MFLYVLPAVGVIISRAAIMCTF